jgi:N-acetylmuramoyl-L-alanine amidase
MVELEGLEPYKNGYNFPSDEQSRLSASLYNGSLFYYIFSNPDHYTLDVIEITTLKKKMVTTDTGHGDNNSKNNVFDPGAVGENGVDFEKEYALALESATSHWLEAFGGIDAKRTRVGDINVDPLGPINWRWKIANNNNSNIFVSFHLNGGTLNNASFAVYQQGKGIYLYLFNSPPPEPTTVFSYQMNY